MSPESDENKHPEPSHAQDTESTQDVVSDADNAKVDWQNPRTWPKEVGGSQGPEPTRYGDWESNGRCTDF